MNNYFFLIYRYEYSLQQSTQIHLSTLKIFWIGLLVNFIMAITTDVDKFLKTKCLHGYTFLIQNNRAILKS